MRWVVEPRFMDLRYAKDERIFYGWKFNDASGLNDKEGSQEDARQYGQASSVIFNSDGSIRIQISGRIEKFEHGLGVLDVPPEFKILGMSEESYASGGVKSLLARGAVGGDFFLSYLSDFVSEGLLLDRPLYYSAVDNYHIETRRGFINAQGQFVIEPKFARGGYSTGFDARYAIVRTGERLYGLIDRSGAWVMEPKYRKLNRTSSRGREYLEAIESQCGWFTCQDTLSKLNLVSLTVIETNQWKRYKHSLVNTLVNDARSMDNQESITRLGIGAWLAGAFLMWPFCTVYQMRKKGRKFVRAVAAGFGWGALLSAGTLICTFVFLIIVAMTLLSGGVVAGVLAGGRVRQY